MDFKTVKRIPTGHIQDKQPMSFDQIIASFSFQKWFGESKIRDAAGKPLEVYHGGLRFDSFRERPESLAHFASDDYAIADGYADQYSRESAEIKALFLRIENPLDLRDFDLFEKWIGLDPRQCDASSEWGIKAYMAHNNIDVRSGGALLKKARLAGHDGVIFFDTDVRNRSLHTSYAFFEPEQAKLALGIDATLNHYKVRQYIGNGQFDPGSSQLDR